MKNFITNLPGGILCRKCTVTLQTICLLPLDIDGKESRFTEVTENITPPPSFGKFLQYDKYLLGIPRPNVTSGEITTNFSLFGEGSRRGVQNLSTDPSLLLFRGGHHLAQKSGTVSK